MVRDPRDILVSAYYSFGYSHSLSPVETIQDRQKTIREEIKNQTVDEYAIHAVYKQQENFELLHELHTICQRSVVLKYENMINNFDFFASQLTKYIHLNDNVVKQIYKKSRPKEIEEITAHRRSGQVGDFRNKLKPETIDFLNKELKSTLSIFGYNQ